MPSFTGIPGRPGIRHPARDAAGGSPGLAAFQGPGQPGRMSRTSLDDSRLPDVEAADAAVARGEFGRQCWQGLMVLVDSATRSAVAGVVTAYAAPFLGISVSPAAGILAATVATVAVHPV